MHIFTRKFDIFRLIRYLQRFKALKPKDTLMHRTFDIRLKLNKSALYLAESPNFIFLFILENQIILFHSIVSLLFSKN
jgi:hypothetical protein